MKKTLTTTVSFTPDEVFEIIKKHMAQEYNMLDVQVTPNLVYDQYNEDSIFEGMLVVVNIPVPLPKH